MKAASVRFPLTPLFKGFLSLTAGLLLAGSAAVHAGVISDSLKQDALFTLQGKELVPYDTSSLDKTNLFAIYFSAEWCPPCRAFTPDLVAFYKRVKKNHPDFELIFCSSDRSPDAMVKYMTGAKMPWPVVDYEKRSLLKQYGGRGIPCLVVVDADGKVLMHSYEGETYVGPRKVMADLTKHLSKQQAERKNQGTDFQALFSRKPGQKD